MSTTGVFALSLITACELTHGIPEYHYVSFLLRSSYYLFIFRQAILGRQGKLAQIIQIRRTDVAGSEKLTSSFAVKVQVRNLYIVLNISDCFYFTELQNY